ncbi:MoaF N-terminal domain-containing protein [Micrococcales bacterium 31B]|nr:MoaF N-terminal domain-containing protein [Micrococcales bacterium 31B]
MTPTTTTNPTTPASEISSRPATSTAFVTVDSQEFVPIETWPDVSEMLEGFGEPSLPASDSLVGQTLDVNYEGGITIRHTFASATSLTWLITAGEGSGDTGTHTYRAIEVREGIFYIEFQKGESVKTHALVMIVNLADGRVTTADSYFVGRNGQVRMQTDFISGRLVGSGEIEPRERTDYLVGKRVLYRYSATEAYEHVYLNASTVAWQCVRGGEKGLADVEQTKAFELGDDLVIYFWTETVMPVESVLVIDFQQQRSIGRMFCWENSTLDPVHLPFDSRLTLLSETTYPDA